MCDGTVRETYARFPERIADVNLMLLSCNVEMTEVAGGTSWEETTTVTLPHRKCCEERGT